MCGSSSQRFTKYGRSGLTGEEPEGHAAHQCRPLPSLYGVDRRPDPVAGGESPGRARGFPRCRGRGRTRRRRTAAGSLTSRPPPRCHLPTWTVRIAGRLQRPGQRRGLRIEEIGLPARPVAGAGLEIAGDPPTGRELAGDQPAPRWRADRRGRIITGEPDPLRRHPVEVRRRDRAAVAGEVARPEVIGEDHDHVGPAVLDARRGAGGQGRDRRDDGCPSERPAHISFSSITRFFPRRSGDRAGLARWRVLHRPARSSRRRGGPGAARGSPRGPVRRRGFSTPRGRPPRSYSSSGGRRKYRRTIAAAAGSVFAASTQESQ